MLIKIAKKVSALGLISLVLSLLAVQTAAAHVVVTPGEAVTSSRVTFAVSVPNEHDTPVVGVRLVVPEGLASVRPFAKAGWDVSVTKSGEGENVTATEITWTSKGGTVPVDLKDDFLFGAKLPAEPTELKWKAYETYQNGLVVAWEQEPSEEDGNKPYSVTKVVSETAAQATLNKVEQATADAGKSADRALYVGIVALALSVVALIYAMRNQSKSEK